MQNSRFVLLVFVFTTLSVLQGTACVLEYSLSDSAGTTWEVRPGTAITLQSGTTYTLKVQFTPEHGRCQVPAEDTLFLLDDEKWLSGKDYLPLQLLDSVTWQKTGSRTYTADLHFEARLTGEIALEVLRECSKGGYDEWLSFAVE